MHTFFILLIVVFAPFVWFIVRSIRYTNETVGEDSPVYRERTYEFSDYQYFGQFTKLLLAFILIQMIMIVYVMSKAAIIQHEPLLFLFVLLFSAFVGYLGFVFYFDWQYWTITRNVLITFNPLKKSITVNGPTQYSVLTPDNVVRIEQHIKKISSSKDPLGGYGYYLFYTTDNQITRVNNLFFSHIGHFEFLERFFPNTPQTIVEHRLPWITDLNQTKNTNAPNFAV